MFPHELGHNFGRLHVPSPQAQCFGTPANLDPNWPNSGPFIEQVGFDVVAGKALLMEDYADWMSYCAPTWTSIYTYNAIVDAFRTSAVADISGGAGQDGLSWLVSGFLDESGASLDPVFVVEALTPGEGSGDYRIEVRDPGGEVLLSRAFQPEEGHWPGTDPSPIFAELIPVVEGAAEIIVLSPGSEVLGIVALGGAVPSVGVSVTSEATVQSAECTAEGEVTLIWEVEDPDSDGHMYIVEYSADGGTTWEPLSTRLSEPGLIVDLEKLRGSDNARVRVLASDGANTGVGVSEPFLVPCKLPAAEITAPANGSAFKPGQLVWLQAFTYDADDLSLDDASITWSSSVDGPLGTGDDLPVYDLSVGNHTITLTVTDSDDNAVTETVGITVGDVQGGLHSWGDLDCDGEITSRDGQALLRKILQQTALSQTPPCPVLGDAVTTAPAALPARMRWWN